MAFSALVEPTKEFFLAYGVAGLFIIAFIESSFFPIPPDVVLIPLTVANPALGLWYAALATVGSVLGAVFGYWLGYKGGRPVLERYVSDRNIDRVQEYYDDYGVWAVGIAGFTPIPYKVFAISSGTFKLDMKGFIAASIIGRGARFFVVAGVIMLYGEEIIALLNRFLGIGSIIIAAVVVAVYVYWKRYL